MFSRPMPVVGPAAPCRGAKSEPRITDAKLLGFHVLQADARRGACRAVQGRQIRAPDHGRKLLGFHVLQADARRGALLFHAEAPSRAEPRVTAAKPRV